MARKRVDVRAILADVDLRRELMVSTIQATQAREGIETTRAQADRAYYVVKEADNAVFFDLERYRGGKRSEPERRAEMFVRALRERDGDRLRFDVARRDFGSIDTSPLAYRRVGLVARIFRESPTLEPTWGIARQGKATGGDAQWIRYFWEVSHRKSWVPFAKGGGYSRFYFDVHLVIDWKEEHRSDLKACGNGLPSLEHYFKPGLTWPLRTQRGFNLRFMPAGCVFGHKGPAIFPTRKRDAAFLLGLGNSALAEYLLMGLASFGSWEVGVIKRLPVPIATEEQREAVGMIASEIHDAKARWDEGNEISTRLKCPWLIASTVERETIPDMLDALAEQEAAGEAHIQALYAELNNAVYKLYGINADTRGIIEETLGERPPEILWPQMEGKTKDQKRMEHVWRLLSYAVKRVVEADADGIVPLIAVSGETALVDRVRDELAALFPDQDAYQLEVDIGNELRRKVKGYRGVDGIDEWLRDCYFDYQVSLYKKRPIFWHIASRPGRGDCAFGALVQYHRFDQNRLAKLRGSYLRDAIALFRREAGLADKDGRIEDRLEWQARLEEAESLNERLRWVQEGINGPPAPGDCRIRTPWKSDDVLPDGWQPDLDDGVAVNIRPLQTAGVLRVESAL